MNGQWTNAFPAPAPDVDVFSLTRRMAGFLVGLQKCPKCRALIEESDTLMHELECWK
jgi:hypothetical protein